ncbi:hypothetical protein XENTR_v10020339 [Xenopus tropicalis]|nr:hypothetical protein XENTR_v10020339 [Xenopus tropicalis]
MIPRSLCGRCSYALNSSNTGNVIPESSVLHSANQCAFIRFNSKLWESEQHQRETYLLCQQPLLLTCPVPYCTGSEQLDLEVSLHIAQDKSCNLIYQFLITLFLQGNIPLTTPVPCMM